MHLTTIHHTILYIMKIPTLLFFFKKKHLSFSIFFSALSTCFHTPTNIALTSSLSHNSLPSCHLVYFFFKTTIRTTFFSFPHKTNVLFV
eukprot:UN10753